MSTTVSVYKHLVNQVTVEYTLSDQKIISLDDCYPHTTPYRNQVSGCIYKAYKSPKYGPNNCIEKRSKNNMLASPK